MNSARLNGSSQGYAQERLYIKSMVCGKGVLFKKIDIKGRGKMGMITVPKSTIKIVLEERHPIDYYKLLLKGQCPPGMGEMVRTMLTQSEADFDMVRKMSHLTTANGRYYRRTQF